MNRSRELDFNILKAIISNKSIAIDFAHHFDHKLFDDEVQDVARMVRNYVNLYRDVPTKRTLLAKFGDSEETNERIDSFWNDIQNHKYDLKEYTYDLEELKNRYISRLTYRINHKLEINLEEQKDPELILKDIQLQLQSANIIKEGRSHIQKSVGDYVDEFTTRYAARQSGDYQGVEIKTGYSMLDSVTGGLSPAELIVIGGETNAGKALDIQTPILTTKGWLTMGELNVGDCVYDEVGEPTKIVAVTDIMNNHECYEITFSCGEKIIADAGHKWKTLNFRERRSKLKNTDEYRVRRKLTRKRIGAGINSWTALMNSSRKYAVKGPLEAQSRTTKEIFETVRVFSKKEQPYNHTINPSKPLQFSKKDLIIDPYVLGAWLGDGDGDGDYGSIASNDQQIIDEIKKHYVVNKHKSKYRYGILKLSTDLKKYNLIKNKHIPLDYMNSSFNQRVALLQGLMDTDGTVTKSGSCEFCTVKKTLKDQMLELLCSLGIIPKWNKSIAQYSGKITGDKYNISFRTSLPAFKLQRKLDKQKKANFKFNYRTITDVKLINSVPVRCIQVESKSHMFLCGKGMIPTHNSQLLHNLATQMWLQDNTLETPPDQFKKGYNVLYFSLEMPYEDCFGRFLSRVADIPQRKTREAKLDEREEYKMKQALKFVEEYQKAGNYFQIVDVPRNVTIEEVELRYQDALLQFKPDVVVIDYMGLMHDMKNANEQDWLKMGAIAASLHEFSRAYDVVMLTAVQLTDVKRGNKGKAQEENQAVGVHRIGRSSHIMHHVNIGIQIETRFGENTLPDLKYHVIKNRKGPLGKGNMIKNFENGALFDVPYAQESVSGDISGNIAELLKNIRDKNE